MKKILALISLFLLIYVVSSDNVLSKKIYPISGDSPIKMTFYKKIIIWRFDDISVRSSDKTINKFFSMTENVTKYGGYVGWGFIPGTNESIEFPRPQNLTYKKNNIEKFNNLTSNNRIFLWIHDWNHSWYTGNNGESVWTTSIQQQREALNFSIWTFYNNFGYHPLFFSAGGSRGNTNTSIVLAERNIILLYGDNDYEPATKDLRYLTLPSSKDSILIEINNPNKENTFDEMKNQLTEAYNSKNNYCILQLMVHPSEWNESTIPIFANFSKWIYINYNLINMNYTEAYNYKHDLESINLDKKNNNNYILDFSNAFKPLNVTWSEPGDWFVKYSDNETTYDEINTTSNPKNIVIIPGNNYSFELALSNLDIKTSVNDNQFLNNSQLLYIEIGSLFLIIAMVLLVIKRKRKK